MQSWQTVDIQICIIFIAMVVAGGVLHRLPSYEGKEKPSLPANKKSQKDQSIPNPHP